MTPTRRLLLGAAATLAALPETAMAASTASTAAPVTGLAPAPGLKLYYEVHGGPLRPGVEPFVLIPGGVMAIETAFAGRLLPILAWRRPVIAIEQQGHGHTADRPGPIDLLRLVDDNAAVLDHLGVRRAHFVGHSLGGMISTGMAIRHPDRVASLTALSAGYTLDGMLPELVTMQRDPTHVPSAELIPLLPTEADFKAWKGLYDRVNPNPAAFDEVLAKLNRMLADWAGWTPAELGAIRAPALIGLGDTDFIRIEHAAEMRRLIPGSRLAVLPHTTHMSIIDRGAWLEPMIREITG
jgi:pimeloyl-ACP methyl ester carboxylesterase